MDIVSGTTAKLVPNQPVADVSAPVPATPQTDPATHQKIDLLEQALLAEGDLIDLPLAHIFTPGLYTRAIHMPAGSLVVSKIHKTEHPFAVMTGRVSVFIPGGEPEEIIAPHVGVTLPGTRRVLYCHTDVIWVTFHTNPEDTKDIDEIEHRIIERRLLENGQSTFDVYADILREIQSAGELPEQYDYQGAP
jgi:hypothetical protein